MRSSRALFSKVLCLQKDPDDFGVTGAPLFILANQDTKQTEDAICNGTNKIVRTPVGEVED
jgi:hypothetical protein